MTAVRLVAVPVRLALSSEANLQDLARALDAARPQGRHPEAQEVFAEARRILDEYADAYAITLAAAVTARDEARRLIDVDLTLPGTAARDLHRLLHLLDEVAEHCRAELPLLVPSAELVAFRRWVADEVERQLAGVRASACPFPVVAADRPVPPPLVADRRVHTSGRMLLDLQVVTAALAGADDTAAVNAIVLNQLPAALGAATASISLLAADGETLERVGNSGYPDEVSDHWASYPLSADLPASEAVRTGVPLFLRARADTVAAYPALTGQPLVEVEAAAVLPLSVADGRVLGALALGYAAERDWRLEDRAVLGLIGDAIAQALDRARLHDAERVAAERLAQLYAEQREISRALQRSLLPMALPPIDGVDLGVSYAAAGGGEEVGGDFYDVLALQEGLLVSIGDVRGRGVDAAALTGLVRHTIRALGRLGLAPDEILRRLNEALQDSAADEPEAAFCTALTGHLEWSAGQLRFSFASGGHPAPFLLRASASEVQRPSVRGDLLGVLPEVELVVTEIPLHPGDVLVLVTDGVLERRRGGAFFDDEGVVRTMLAHRAEAAGELAERIAAAARAFGSEATSDDMAVVVVRMSGS